MQENQSEMVQLLRRIEDEYSAAKVGLSGLCSGAAKHQFITARMENIGAYCARLSQLVGEENAIRCVLEAAERQIP
ncbi:hypothetical protein KSD_10400 [Ktedonobacter sp. SOSP1-85]|uniref:hypothetical protein n=1 Tax=Ktedonobacter sp. SOSP1-85 TaxID=2778367 RepID=UPI0019156F96|nr:hypothetical protein [Ktedonobacter sp. SOSP1-85]GHO73269.1 hypothetical protein KSD_10400 [Ktedonobacter sp. SOSP1-85]